MPEKYFINVEPAPSRFEPVSKLVSIEQDRCLGCVECAKRDCIYDVYAERSFLPGQLVDSSAGICKLCMRCVQECRNGIIARAFNPSFSVLGNGYWTPQIISSLWQQAATGKIPVSGAGYDGPFSGSGFDSMWTDMSEIVRPTRDGIHGREYIGTSVDIGRKPDHLGFDGDTLKDVMPPFFSLPIPVILDVPRRARGLRSVNEAVSHASRAVRSLFVTDDTSRSGSCFVPRFMTGEDKNIDKSHKMVELLLPDISDVAVEDCIRAFKGLSERFPNTLVCAGLRLEERTADAVLSLVEHGLGVVRLYADMNGNGFDACKEKFIIDMVRSVHLTLVERGVRDVVTIMAGGGIAMAEHVAKLIACGVDLVVADEAVLAALECRLCMECETGGDCPVKMDEVDRVWGGQRIVNMLGSWHSQIIEVMGAMGIRELRRLRGETGRVMFFDDLERECFSPIFGERKCISR